MFVRTLFLLALAIFAFARPKVEVDKPDVDVDAIENRIEFISNFHHEPEVVKEGDIITFTYDPPAPENAEKAKQLVKSFTIAIGTGTGTIVDDQFFIESERLPIPSGKTVYKIQLPAQMEAKQYCIVYTPYATATAEEGNTKPNADNGVPLESLYETWFAVEGSLEKGTGPKSVENKFQNNVAADGAAPAAGTAPAAGADRSVAAASQSAPVATQTTQAATPNTVSGSITQSPAITLFIAVLFACFFI